MKRILLCILILIQSQVILTADAQTGATGISKAEQYNLTKLRQQFWDSLPQPTGWVNDLESIFTSEQKITLDSVINEFNELTDIEIAIVTIDSAFVTYEKFDELTLHMANTWGVGQKNKDNGILIGISKGHRRIRINVGYGLEEIISDSETKAVVYQDFIPSFKEANYYRGALTGLTALIDLLKSRM